MDLPKLHTVCTPEKHWQTVLVNAESVSHQIIHVIPMFMVLLSKQLPREILPAASRRAGRTIGTVFVIADLKGFG